MNHTVHHDRHGLHPAVVGAFLHWWERISRDSAGGIDKADRAVLRRCATPTAVACTGAYQRVYHAMLAAHEGPPWTSWQQDRLAALAGLAAHIKRSSNRSLPQEMHQHPEGGERNRVSELRFKRLLESPDVDSLFTGLRRVLPLIEHQVDLASMASDLFRWNDAVRKRWAYAYYDTAPARAGEQTAV